MLGKSHSAPVFKKKLVFKTSLPALTSQMIHPELFDKSKNTYTVRKKKDSLKKRDLKLFSIHKLLLMNELLGLLKSCLTLLVMQQHTSSNINELKSLRDLNFSLKV